MRLKPIKTEADHETALHELSVYGVRRMAPRMGTASICSQLWWKHTKRHISALTSQSRATGRFLFRHPIAFML